MKNKSKFFKFNITALFVAIIMIMAFTPFGFIQLPFIKATLIHIPVILGGVLLGPGVGALLGFCFGLTSLINNTFAPALSSFVFSPLISLPGTEHGSWLALLICFGPRILVGVVPYCVYAFLHGVFREQKLEWLSLALAAVAGSLTNTLLVMHLIYFLFKDAYATVRNIPSEAVYRLVISVITANGIPEAIVAAVVVTAVGTVLKRLYPE